VDFPKISIRPLLSSDFEQLYYSFLESFQNYPVNLHLEKDDFRFRISERLKINFNISIGVFSGEKMVAFILHTSGEFNGGHAAYNGGTGVIPSYRGLSLVSHMYRAAIPLLRDAGVKSVYLEVLESNAAAKKAYFNIGFEEGRYLRGFKLSKILDSFQGDFKYEISSKVIEELVLQSHDIMSDFMGANDRLIENSSHEKMIVVRNSGDNQPLGFLVFQPKTGRINRFWVVKEARRKGVGTGLMQQAQLLSKNKELVVVNVDSNNKAAYDFLINMGFENQLNQYEMILDVTKFT
jgi:ribosomal protein S18 acetylase RimI-like enzyme